MAPTGALQCNGKLRRWADLPVEKEPVMKKILSLALVTTLSLSLAAPVSAGRGPGGGFHGGFHHDGFRHDGFHRFGCCFGPALSVGSSSAQRSRIRTMPIHTRRTPVT